MIMMMITTVVVSSITIIVIIIMMIMVILPPVTVPSLMKVLSSINSNCSISIIFVFEVNKYTHYY